MPLIKEIKIKVPFTIWDDPKYCGCGYFVCRHIGNMVFCRLFKKALKIIKNDEVKRTVSIKCEECKTAYKKVSKNKDYQKKYKETSKGILAQKRYRKSDKGKDTAKIYQKEYYKIKRKNK